MRRSGENENVAERTRRISGKPGALGGSSGTGTSVVRGGDSGSAGGASAPGGGRDRGAVAFHHQGFLYIAGIDGGARSRPRRRDRRAAGAIIRLHGAETAGGEFPAGRRAAGRSAGVA